MALLIDVLTDNRNRTGAEIRGVFTKHGGSLAEPGVGQLAVRPPRRRARRRRAPTRTTLMLAALEAGADDVADDGGTWRVTSRRRRSTFDVRDALEAAGFAVESADSPMVSENLVPIATVEEAKKVLRIVEAIEDNDDVQDVYANFDIPDDVMDEVMEATLVSGVGVGDRAPASRCRARAAATYSLADYAGQPVVLVFYPGDDTPVCTKQLNTYNDGLDQFTELGAQVLAISAQDVASHERFSAKHGGFDFPLLADTDKAVAAPYGTLGPIGFPRRSVFIVDGDGVIRYAHRAIAGLTYRPVSELVGVLSKL